MQETSRTGSPLLQTALEGLTGLQGNHWKEVKGNPPVIGVELTMPALQHALAEKSSGGRMARNGRKWPAATPLREDRQ